ncbi:intradiol ring-cleavage dioxygenase [Bordetella sp. N]|uniref:intradiol ring-cleavage dioxygenase n=1 Tax=Bordetella sp. N TaxID=1746199 RepID=UPI00070D3B0A|nr:intradiol ring-cleavage dioxygenase [Bordetella sp. N]ALM85903.1 6-chlorohydroxyquinol-1,2-dioxygenase [Bordetella sp. N]
MPQYFSEDASVDAVNARMGEDVSPRLRQVMTSLITHLHGFIKDVQLTQEEWAFAVDFLTRTGQICSEQRQEFILLSDTLGVSMLVDAIGNRRPSGATENTVLGPFHVADAPRREMGVSISADGKGETCLFEGRVLDAAGNLIEGACLDVWSDNADGFYDVQQPDAQPRWNNRGRFTTGADGAYRFIGIKPVSYPIPYDGPVGKMLAALGRHPYRPAHMHFIVTAPGFQTVVTHTFVGDDPYITSDAVFGVKDTLVAPFERVNDGATAWRSPFDFVLVPS